MCLNDLGQITNAPKVNVHEIHVQPTVDARTSVNTIFQKLALVDNLGRALQRRGDKTRDREKLLCAARASCDRTRGCRVTKFRDLGKLELCLSRKVKPVMEAVRASAVCAAGGSIQMKQENGLKMFQRSVLAHCDNERIQSFLLGPSYLSRCRQISKAGPCRCRIIVYVELVRKAIHVLSQTSSKRVEVHRI